MASVDGLVSGLNTSEIISQLMQLERAPQQRLQTQRSTVESGIGALRALNAKFTAITSAADKLTSDKGWQLTAATSSAPTRVAVTATPGAAQGGLTFGVKQLATASSVLSTGFVSKPADLVTTPNTILKLAKGPSGTPVDINTGDGSLAAVMSAINKANAGVSAGALQIKPGEHQLRLTSTTTGAGTEATLTLADGTSPWTPGTLGGLTTFSAGQNAKLVSGATTIERASNTISDLVGGLTLTLLKADALDANGNVVDPPVEVSVKSDPDGVAAQVSALVDAVNAVRADIKAVTGYNLETGAKGKLYGDTTVRGLSDRLATAVVGNGSTSAGLAGVSVSRDGTVVFNKATFLKALADDPVKAQQALGGPYVAPAGTPVGTPAKQDGLADRLRDVSHAASRGRGDEKGPGLLQTAITNRERQVTSLRANISEWDQRLKLRETTLRREFAGLEKALGASQRQGQWLAGQIAGLPGWG